MCDVSKSNLLIMATDTSHSSYSDADLLNYSDGEPGWTGGNNGFPWQQRPT